MSSDSAPAFELHESLAPPLSERLRSELAHTEEQGSGDALFLPLNKVDEYSSSGRRLVAVFDGPLRAHHAQLLRRQPPTLLLACRDHTGVPSTWELELLFAVLRGGRWPARGGENFRFVVSQVSDLQTASKRAADFARASGARQSAVDIVADVMHELAANALLDAPAMDGVAKYAHARGPQLRIAAEDSCEVSATLQGDRIFLSATDHFGRLSVAPLAAAVESLDGRATLDTSGGGGGLGLRRIVEHSDALVVRIQRGVLSEVTSAVDLSHARRRRSNPKSLFFCQDRG